MTVLNTLKGLFRQRPGGRVRKAAAAPAAVHASKIAINACVYAEITRYGGCVSRADAAGRMETPVEVFKQILCSAFGHDACAWPCPARPGQPVGPEAEADLNLALRACGFPPIGDAMRSRFWNGDFRGRYETAPDARERCYRAMLGLGPLRPPGPPRANGGDVGGLS